MIYDFDEEKFSNRLAYLINCGYDLKTALILTIAQYPPLVTAILNGIEKGGKK
ncbi:hypothetical protein ES708_23826 [subsurface metagenome]